MIHITERAKHKLFSIFDEEKKSSRNLRLGVKGGGCSGFTYIMDFADKVNETDQVFNISDVNVVIDSKSLAYLAGTELDYTDGLKGSGFVFKNPNAVRSCGCGSSFSA